MEKYVQIFGALSDPTRLRIYLILTKGELCVCELTCALDMEQSRISHSLGVLRKANLIGCRRIGKWMFYSISSSIDIRWLQQGIKDNVKIFEEDKKRLIQCKRDNIREKYKCQQGN